MTDRWTAEDVAAHNARLAPPSPPTEREAGFQRAVIGLARLHGWRVAHFRPAQTKSGAWVTAVAADGAGFPDLVLVRERVLYRELKSARGKLSDEQRAWRDALLGAGQDWACWRPKDWIKIEVELGARRR